MEQDREPRRSNPFWVGGLGLVLLVVGYVLMRNLAPTSLGLALAGRLTFYAGLGLVLLAAVIWYRQAQAPEEEPEPDPENDDSVADAHRQMFP